MKERVSHDRLLELLDYNCDTGVFTWRVKTGSRSIVGEPAGWIHHSGYTNIKIYRKIYMAHRLAWFYITKSWPENQIDHIDRNKANNSISNLRDVTNQVNTHNNILPRVTNISGFTGVSFVLPNNKYRSRICTSGGQFHLGYFDTPEEAHQAYLSAKTIHHPSFTM